MGKLEVIIRLASGHSPQANREQGGRSHTPSLRLGPDSKPRGKYPFYLHLFSAVQCVPTRKETNSIEVISFNVVQVRPYK